MTTTGDEAMAVQEKPRPGSPEWAESMFRECYLPVEWQMIAHNRLRAGARIFAKVICDHVPMGAERTLAIRKLSEAMYYAHLGVMLGWTEGEE